MVRQHSTTQKSSICRHTSSSYQHHAPVRNGTAGLHLSPSANLIYNDHLQTNKPVQLRATKLQLLINKKR